MTAEQIWLSIAIAIIPASASITAALLAGKYAGRARAAEAEAARLRAAEERLAERKFKLYEPMLQGLGDMMLPGNAEKALPKVEKAMPDFLNFATMWASDEALRAFFRFRIASSSKPPSEITLRLISDFLVAARRDLSGMDSEISGIEILGIRVNELYENSNLVDAFSLPFEDLARKHSWTPPWN